MYGSLCCCNGYNSHTLVVLWVKHNFNLAECLRHWSMLQDVSARCASLTAIMPQEEQAKFSLVKHLEGKREREKHNSESSDNHF